MRIGFFTETYLPYIDGIAYSIDSFRRGLRDLGHETFVFAPAPAKAYTEESPYIKRFPSIGTPFDHRRTSIVFPPRTIRRIEELHLDVVHLHYPSAIGLLGAHIAIKNRLPLVSTWHADLYSYASMYPLALPCLLGVSYAALPLLTVDRSKLELALSLTKPVQSLDSWTKRVVSRMASILHDNCDLVIAPSVKIEKLISSWGTRTPVEVLQTGVDACPVSKDATEKARRRYISPNDSPTVLFVGRLGREKNLELLIYAFSLMLKEQPQARLLLVGDHKDAGRYVRLTEKLSLQDRVTFTGWIDRKDLGPLYSIASVLAFPSKTDTQGLVLYEAAHAGLPIVSVDGQLCDVVQHDVNGLIAQENSEDLAAKLLAITRNPKLRLDMGNASKILVAEYSIDRQSSRLASLYDGLLKSGRGCRSRSSKQLSDIGFIGRSGGWL
jgi:1,2-diacylglycerol 3-alpha-glucosyltransferase